MVDLDIFLELSLIKFDSFKYYLRKMRRFCKISILGSGAFGTAMAHAASFNPHNKVVLYARDENVVKHINEKKRNPKFLSEYELNGNIQATTNFREAIDGAEFILSCLPTQATMGVLK